MGSSKSNLLNYIAHLLDEGNESQLRKFVVDPISDAEGKWGLTKAERSVLRRTVSGLSNNSVNGYSIDRSLSSYRRSLRLLQNVLHNVGTKVAQDQVETADGEETYSLVLYYPNSDDSIVVSNDPSIASGNTYTCKNNEAVDSNRGPYKNHQSFSIALSGSVTIGSLMKALAAQNSIVYDSVGGLVLSFTVDGATYLADVNNDCYNLEKHPDADFAFWFWSLNGEAGPSTSPGTVSYEDYPIAAGTTVYWQLIAPDKRYGFKPCEAHPQNAFGKEKAQASRA